VRPNDRRGFSLIEVMIAMVVLVLAILGLAEAMVYSTRLSQSARYQTLAMNAARQKIEEMRNCPNGFRGIFNMYGAAGANSTFTVSGLPADPPGAAAGQIVFNVNAANQLVESAVDSTFGALMGFTVDYNGDGVGDLDLDGDGAIDAADHAGDYIVLPVLIRVTWRDAFGNRTYDYATQLVSSANQNPPQYNLPIP
jgi:prepilin-type N-terminal cleavage/methylation domain-containing protein